MKKPENKVANIAIALGATLVLIVIFTFIFKHVFPTLLFPQFSEEIPEKSELLTALILAPLTEEFIFRHLPISIFKRINIWEEVKWYIIALIAVGFGLAHGHMTSIFVQGVAGFFFGWVYIKNNYSYWSAVVTHSLYNLIVLVIIPSLI